MKKKIIILLTCFILSGCKLYDEYKMPKEVSIKLNDNKFEVYSDIKIKDLIKSKNVKILNNNELVKTNKTGVKSVTIEYKYRKREYKYDVNYDIVDTEKPILLNAPKSYNYYLNDEVEDFCLNVSVIDNYDRSLDCIVNSDIDTTKVGKYDLEYIIKDSSNNEIKESFVVNIIDPETIEETNNEDDYYYEEKVDFSEIVRLHKNDNTMIGIDVSRWQGDINFEDVKRSGAEFVIIRMAVSNGVDDEIGLDSYFTENIKKAKDAGLKVGVYVYTAASSIPEVRNQAKFVKKHLNKTPLDFPIAYDFETWNDINELEVNTHDLINMVDEFYKIVNKDGYDVMLYSSKYYLEKVWLNKNYPVWLAHYTDKTNYEGKYIMWQMASNGKISGIDGDVDIDIYYKN